MKKHVASVLFSMLVLQPALAGTTEYRIPLQGLNSSVTAMSTGSATGVGAGSIDVGNSAALPTLTFDPQAQAFDMSDASDTTRTSLLTNNSAQPLTPTGFTSNTSFSVSPQCPTVLAPGANCVVTVSRTADAVVGSAYDLTVLARGSAQEAVLSLSTYVPPDGPTSPHLKLDTNMVNLGTLTPGMSASGQATLTNTGNGTANIRQSFSGSNITFDTSDCPTNLVAGAHCTIGISYQAPTTAVGTTTAKSTLTLKTSKDDIGIQLTAYATVTGPTVYEPSLHFSKSTVTLGPVNPGEAATAQVSLQNTGSAAATLAPLQNAVPDFTVQSACPTSLPAGSDCVVTITFKTQSASSEADTLVAQAQDGVSDKTSLVGLINGATGPVHGPALSFGPPSIDFSNVFLGHSVTQQATLTNVGDEVATLQKLIVDTGMDSYAQTNDCGASLAPGASCSVTVTFTPSTTGTRQGSITATLDTGASQKLMLTGYGLLVDLWASPAPVVYGSVTTLGALPATTIEVGNQGNYPVTGLAITTTDPRLAIVNNCTDTIPGNNHCSLQMTYTTATDGPFSSSFQIASSDAASQTVAISGTVVRLSVSPASLTFPTTAVGTSAPDQQATLTNTGHLSVPLDGISVAPGAENFGASNNCGSALAAGASCTIAVRFTPQGGGAHSGTIDISSGGSAVAQIALSGTAPSTTINLSPAPSTLSFNPTQVGTASPDQQVTLTNANDKSVALDPIIVSDSADFAETDNCGSALAPGASCVLSVKFTPQSEHGKSGTVYVTSAGAKVAQVGLSGDGYVSQLQVNPSPLNFAAVNVGESAKQNFVISNPTPATATISGISIAQNSAEYAQSNSCGSGIAPGAQCYVIVQWTPVSTQANPGTLAIDSSFGPYSVTLNGAATAPTPVINPPTGAGPATTTSDGMTHYAITFADTQVYASSAVRNVTLSNSGTGPLGVQGISVVNGAADFSQSNDCGTAVAPGASCTIAMLFTPSVTGLRTGNIVLSSDTGMYSFDLQGKGLGPTVQLYAETTTDFGSVLVGSSAQRQFTFKNMGTVPASAVVATLTGAHVSLLANTCGTATVPASVAAGTTCSMTVQYTPTDIGTFSGSLVVSSDAVNGSQSVALTGKSVEANGVLTAQTTTDFGTVVVNSTKSLSFQFENTGNADATGVAASVSGTGMSITSNSCGTSAQAGTVPAGNICTVTVQYSAGNTPGAISGTLTIVSSAVSSPNTISMTGTVPPNPGTLAVASGSSTNYGSVSVGASATNTFTFTNGGGATITGVQSRLTGSQDISFSSSTCGSVNATITLAPGASCSMAVRYKPSVSGTLNATLSVASSATNGTQTLTLTGNATGDPYYAAATELLTPLDTNYNDVAGGRVGTPHSGNAGSISLTTAAGTTVANGAMALVNTIGATGSADANGNGLTFAASSASTDVFSMGSGNFTIEGWFKWTSFRAPANTKCVGSIYIWSLAGGCNISWPAMSMNLGNTTGSTTTLSVALSSSAMTNSGPDIAYYTGVASVSLNTWYHVALVRNGGVFTVYLNGAPVWSKTVAASTVMANAGSGLLSGAPYFAIGSASVGEDYNGNHIMAGDGMTGYVDDFRVTKGVARYTTSFTPMAPDPWGK